MWVGDIAVFSGVCYGFVFCGQVKEVPWYSRLLESRRVCANRFFLMSRSLDLDVISPITCFSTTSVSRRVGMICVLFFMCFCSLILSAWYCIMGRRCSRGSRSIVVSMVVFVCSVIVEIWSGSTFWFGGSVFLFSSLRWLLMGSSSWCCSSATGFFGLRVARSIFGLISSVLIFFLVFAFRRFFFSTSSSVWLGFIIRRVSIWSASM